MTTTDRRDDPMSDPRHWRVLDDIVVRRAGWPVDLLDELAAPGLVEVAEEYERTDHALQKTADRVRGQLRRAIADPTVVAAAKELRRIRRALDRGVAVEGDVRHPALREPAAHWDAAVRRTVEQRGHLRREFAARADVARASLRRMVSSEEFHDVALLNSPDFLDRGLRPYLDAPTDLAPARRRAIERTLTAYVQRLCSRNETASFFGPVWYAQADPSAQRCLPDPAVRVPSDPRDRHVHVSAWVVRSLAAAMEADDLTGPEQQLERSALHRFDGTTLVLPVRPYPRIELTTAEREVMAAATDGLRVKSLDPAARAALPSLSERELVRTRIPLATGELDMLLALRDEIDEWDDEPRRRWRPVVRRIEELAGDLADATGPKARTAALRALEAYLAEQIDGPLRRGQGALYADRLVFFEQYVEPVPFPIGAAFVAELERRLRGVLNVLASAASYVHGRRLALATDGVDEAGLTGQRVGLLDAIDRFPRPEPAEDQVTQWLDEWRAGLGSGGSTPSGGSLDLSSETLLGDNHPEAWAGSVASVDVMVSAADADAVDRGEFTLVVGEVHPALVLCHDALFAYHPDRAGLHKRARRILARADPQRAEMQIAAERVTKVTDAPVGRGRLHRAWVEHGANARDVAVADLDLDLGPAGPPALLPAGSVSASYLRRPLFVEEPLPLLLACVQKPELWTEPLVVGPCTPRVLIDGVVVQRSAWTVYRDDFPILRAPADSVEAFAAVQAWRKRRQLPRRLFARPHGVGEVKPVLVDFDSPLSVMVFLHGIRLASSVVLVEMYPDRDALWLSSGRHRYTCELRLTVWVDSEQPAGDARRRPNATSRPDNAPAADPATVRAALRRLTGLTAPLRVED